MTRVFLNRIAIGMFALLVSIGATAQADPRPIDVETAVALALKSNLGIQSEAITVAQKKLIADTWWNRFYPSVSARATLARMNEEQSGSVTVPLATSLNPATGGFDEVSVQSFDVSQWSFSTGLDISLDLTMQMFPGITLAKLDYDAGSITLEDAKRKVARDAAKQFYDLLLLRRRVELLKQQIDAAEDRYDQARINYENGLVDEYTSLSARVAWENLKPQLTNLETGYAQALMAFKSTLGIPLTEVIEPAGDISPPELDLTLRDVDRDLLERRLGIRQLDALDTILAEQYELINSARLPMLRLGLSFDPALSNADEPDKGPFRTNWFDGDNWSQRSGMFSITVVQPLDPWLPHSQVNNELEGIRREREKNAITREQALVGAEMESRGLIMSINGAEETITALELNIDLAQRAYDLAEIGYQNGLRDLLEVQNAELELLSAQVQVLEQKKNIMTNLLDLEYALNTPLTQVGELVNRQVPTATPQEDNQ